MSHEISALFVHCSLSSCGRFTNGPDDVLAALAERTETLGFPTHTYNYPENGAVAPLFNSAITPSMNGVLTEMFRQRATVHRSIHSTHSMAVNEAGAELIAGHYENDTPCGPGTPYQRLIQRKASILMFGVTFHSYTLFHTAEDAAESPFAYEESTRDTLRVVDENGVVRECDSKRQSRVPRRFAEAGEWLVRTGLVKRLSLGRNELLFVRDCSKVHDLLVERLMQTPDLLYQNCSVDFD